MICVGESILKIGWMLSMPTSSVTINAVTRIDLDGVDSSSAISAFRTRRRGNIFFQNPSSKHAKAGTIVNQFKKERLPLNIIVI